MSLSFNLCDVLRFPSANSQCGTRGQITSFVEGVFTLNTQYDKFRLNLRDFLISLKEFADDNAELFVVEKEQQERDAKAADLERRAKVGGLLKPSEIEEDEL
jgi:exportin-1